MRQASILVVCVAVAAAQQPRPRPIAISQEFDERFQLQDFEAPVRASQPQQARRPAKISSEEVTEEPDINTIPGVPGQSYPNFHRIPRTNFDCSGKIPGYYADQESRCQAWHYCDDTGKFDSFLCPNGTIYDQSKRVCDWWFSVDCTLTDNFRDINKDLYIIPLKVEEEASSEEEVNVPKKSQRQRTQSQVPVFIPSDN